VNRIEISPGQTKDVMITLPSGSGSWYPEVSYGSGSWYPEVSYRDLRNSNTYNNGRVFTRIDY